MNCKKKILSVQFGSVGLGSVRFGSVQFSSVQSESDVTVSTGSEAHDVRFSFKDIRHVRPLIVVDNADRARSETRT